MRITSFRKNYMFFFKKINYLGNMQDMKYVAWLRILGNLPRQYTNVLMYIC